MNLRRWFGRDPATVTMPAEAMKDADSELGDRADGLESAAISPDHPIERPEQDVFGFDPFARAIATSIAGLKSPEGLVIGIHGPWGSGKSSAVNLVKHHLTKGGLKGAEDLTLVEFNPWWFNGADALAIAFFREMDSSVGKSLPAKTRRVLRDLGRKLESASPLIEVGMNLATAGTGGAAMGGGVKFVGDLLDRERTVLEQHAEIAKALRSEKRRFLVVIDDLDRLSVDDALLVFKLVKSAGRLPNVVYLMVFDQVLIQTAIEERFPSEGPHFLEKIVQAGFELPPPEPHDLRNLLLKNVDRIIGQIPTDQETRFMNVFYDVVAPNVALPRDIVRLTNALEVTWPAVTGDVDAADFLAMESLRQFWPRVHRAIYNNKTLVCGHELSLIPQGQAKDHCNAQLLGSVSEQEWPQLQKALMRLFPALENAWKNNFYDAEFEREWRQQRRVCVEAHFDPYFRLTLSDQAASAKEIEALLGGSDDPDFFRDALYQALASTRRRGGTNAAVLLDELTVRAEKVPETSIGPLVAAIFGMADELDIAADRSDFFWFDGNFLRLHRLLNRLVYQRLAIEQRDAVLEAAAQTATLRWLIVFSLRCVRLQESAPNGQVSGEPLTSAGAAERLRALTLARVEAAAADGIFIRLPDLVSNLFSWRDLIGDGGADRVRAWVAERLGDDALVEALARSFITVGWTQTAGDVAARREHRVNRDSVEALVDPVALRARMTQILSGEDVEADRRAAIEQFEAAWMRLDRGILDD